MSRRGTASQLRVVRPARLRQTAGHRGFTRLVFFAVPGSLPRGVRSTCAAHPGLLLPAARPNQVRTRSDSDGPAARPSASIPGRWPKPAIQNPERQRRARAPTHRVLLGRWPNNRRAGHGVGSGATGPSLSLRVLTWVGRLLSCAVLTWPMGRVGNAMVPVPRAPRYRSGF